MSASDTKTGEIVLPDLLRAKLHRPRVTRDLMVRPRLVERLNSGLDGRLTLVSAAAGFGKTTLISSWLNAMAATGAAGTAPPSAWLSLDERDGDLVVFLRYLIGALRTLFPEAGSETLALLQAPSPVLPADLSTMLSNEIDILPRNFVLVLDDYHLLTGQAVHDLLNDFLHHWPRPLHLVLVSRIDPPIALANLRARGKIAEIRTDDLRFNAEEVAAYLERAIEIPLRQQDHALLERETEGWIAALQLATLSLRSTHQVENIPAILDRTGRGISDYLQEEVLSRQVPAVQMFLRKTSILERFCSPLCEAVVEQSDPAWSVRACLDWIERADLFLVLLDDREHWYRYHPLFRDFLKEKLLASFRAEEVVDLHRKAATWFAQAGMVHEAARHALEARDLDLAVEVIEQRLCDVLNREDWAMLEQWLALLPEEVVRLRPWLLLAKAWSLQPSWQLRRQSRLVSQVEALLEQGDSAALPADASGLLQGHILTLKAQYACLSNQLAPCVASCEEALTLLPRDWTYVRGGAKLYWGLAMGASGQGQAAERVLLDEYESLGDKTTGYALRILQAVCMNHFEAGRLEPAGQTAYVMQQQAIRGGLTTLQGWAHLFLGAVHYQWNDLDAAGVHLAEILDQRYLVQSLAAHHGMAGLARVYQARGEPEEAWRVVDILSRFQVEQRGFEEEEVRSLRAGLMLDQGDLEGTYRWADAFSAPPADRPLFWIEVPHLTRARILLARNSTDDVRLALQILDDLHDIAARTHNARCTITILALRALALDAQGHAGQALLTLQEAVDLSRPGGFLRPFVDLGPRMEALLGRLAGQAYAAEPVRRILAAFPGSATSRVASGAPGPPERTSDPAPRVPVLAEPLTARELEILRLLREPIWPKEIAVRCDISYLTVKRHTVNLYGKLGVNTRWDAVSRAIELGILPPR